MAKKSSHRKLMEFVTRHHVMTFPGSDGEIRTVDLRTKETTDDILAYLKELPSLKKLTLQGTLISDKGLAHLAQLEQLEELDLRSCAKITDAGMSYVSEIEGLKDLKLYDTNIGDEGLCELARLKDLESLNLHSTHVTDDGLRYLKSFPRLRDLNVGGKILTDACFEQISSLKNLEWLNVGESAFTDHGIAQIGGLTRLNHLSIAWTRITGTGFKQLADLTKLVWLNARESRFLDEGLKYLAPFQRLKDLSLTDTKVTDKGIRFLKKLKKLKDLNLEGTGVTAKGKADLKKQLPRCVVFISADQGTADIEQYDDEYFWSNPPHCLAGFETEPLRDEPPTTHQLSCRCGSKTGTVLGHPLSKYNADYEGTAFVGPLAFRCHDCGMTTEIIDTDIHGYDGESGSSVTIRGKGKRTGFRCPECDSNTMAVLVRFAYDGGELDLKEDEPTIAVEDFFGWFWADGICAKCKSRFSIADFECA